MMAGSETITKFRSVVRINILYGTCPSRVYVFLAMSLTSSTYLLWPSFKMSSCVPEEVRVGLVRVVMVVAPSV